MTPAEAEAARLSEYTALFKNALVYTVVMGNARTLMEGHDGSVSILLLSFIVAASIALKIEHHLGVYEAEMHGGSAAKSIAHMACFIAGLFSNVMVQCMSQLVAEAIGRSLQLASVSWSMVGVFMSIILIYVMNKVSSGVAVTCVSEETRALLRSSGN